MHGSSVTNWFVFEISVSAWGRVCIYCSSAQEWSVQGQINLFLFIHNCHPSEPVTKRRALERSHWCCSVTASFPCSQTKTKGQYLWIEILLFCKSLRLSFWVMLAAFDLACKTIPSLLWNNSFLYKSLSVTCGDFSVLLNTVLLLETCCFHQITSKKHHRG